MLPIVFASLVSISTASIDSITIKKQSAGQDAAMPLSQGRKSENNDIVVIGNKIEKYKQIIAFAESITHDLDFDSPLARYTDPVCLEINGISKIQSYDIFNRILSNFKKINIRFLVQNCRVNASVFFVDNPNKIMKSIYNKKPMVFGPIDYKKSEKKLKENERSIVIQNIILRGVDGDDIVGKVVASRSSSIIDLPIRKDILSSIVLIDRKSILDYSTDQISDFVTFQILANIQIPSTKSGESILELFNIHPPNSPAEMTGWDISYLKEIYSGSGNLRGVRKIGQVTRRILRENK